VPDEIAQACVDPATVWTPLRNPVLPPEAWAAVPAAESDIAGFSERSGVIVRLAHYRGMDVVEALREAKDASGTRVLPEVAGALLAACRAGRRVRNAEGPNLDAALTRRISREAGPASILPPGPTTWIRDGTLAYRNSSIHRLNQTRGQTNGTERLPACIFAK
jgi:hypothetical protein